MSNRSSDIRRRLFLLSPLLLATTALLSAGLSLWMLHASFRRQQEQMITQEVKGRLQLLETISRSNHGDRDKTIAEFAKFNAKYSRLGATGEITIACREKGGLRFLLQKHPEAARFLAAAPTKLAEPIRKALEGKSGTLLGKDYRGIDVLAAYAPVPDLHWGIVAKVDASEIEAPLLRTSVVALSVVMLLVLGGCLLITHLGRPLLRDLEQSQQRFDLALRGTSSGLWDWPDVNRDEQWWSPRLYELAGYGAGEITSSLSQFRVLLHPNDVARARQAMEAHFHARVPYDMEYRLRTKGGEYRWFRIRGQALWDSQGKPLRMSGFLDDIDKQKKAEEALWQSNAELQAMYDGMADGLLIADLETKRLLRANAAICTMLGYSMEELRSMSVTDVHPAADVSAVMEILQAQVEGRLQLGEDLPVLRKDGTLCRADIRTERILYHGRPCLIGFFRDVTQRHRMEKVLRDSEERYRSLVENIDLGILLIDRQHRLVMVNEAGARIVDSTAKEIVGQECFRVFEKREMVCDHCPGEKAMATGHAAEAEWHGVRTDGSAVAVRQRAFPVRGSDGVPSGFIEVVEDITERKRADETLRHTHDQLQTIYDGIIEGLLITDVETKRFVRVSSALCQMLGYTEQELLQLSIKDIHPPEEAPNDLQRFDAAAEGRVTIDEDRPVLRKDGSIFYADITAHRIVYQGRPSLLALFRDITERKQTAKKLIEAKLAAEAASRAKSEFLANMSHEIRTPMTAILGFSEIILDASVGEEVCEAARTIKRNGEHLLTIINDILDLSKIEAGRQDLETLECSPHEVLMEVVSTMQVPAEAKGLALRVEGAANVPKVVRTDPRRLRQILVNLIGNAIKFTEVGSVRVVVRMDTQATEKPALRFDVVDTGIGLSPEQLGGLFRPFCQADGSSKRRFGGTGLGLALSRRLANLLGGEITVTSTLGQGSTFSLAIASVKPGPKPSGDHAPLTPRVTLPQRPLHCRILLAEDGPDNQRLIAHVLRKAGAEITVAQNGQRAVELVLAAEQAGNPFDIVLMDMQMPVMDGFEATTRLRSAGLVTPIIALTAHAMVDDRQRCLDAGCNAYVGKPLDVATLLAAVARHLAAAPVQR
jgi:two-component system CheB/CheR fusion protein